MNSGGYLGDYGGHYIPTGVYGNYTVVSGGMLMVSNSDLHGAVTVANGGRLKARGAIMYGPVTVANGGELDLLPGSFGLLSLQIYAPLTNSGTINMTNASLGINNYGTSFAHGSVINQAGGLIDFWDVTASGSFGSFIGGNSFASFVNQGRIIKSSGAGFVGLFSTYATNQGTITAQTGSIFMEEEWTLLPAGSLNVGLNSVTNYGRFIFSTNSQFNPVGNVGLAGTFNATLNNGYVPTNGTSFNVASYGSFTGNFTSLGLPSAVSWQSIYGSTNFTLVAGSAQPQFGTFNLSGTNLIFNGIGGSPGSNYVILASTNLTVPLTNWLALTTNTFDGSGQFHYTNNVNPANPRQFFIFKLP
jgi:hypothetical protein